MLAHQPTMQRDPHLPPPSVCDWLSSLEWSTVVPVSITRFPKGGPFDIRKSERFDYVYATAALGADEIVEIRLPAEALQVLELDVSARKIHGNLR